MDVEINWEIPLDFAFLYDPKSYKGVYGGRDSAKSHSVAQFFLIKGMNEACTMLATREYQVSIRDSVKSLLDRIIKEKNLSFFYTSTRDEIRGLNGSRIIFFGLKTNPDNIQSYDNIKYVWCEEAHRTSQASLDILIPTIRIDDSEIWFSYNRKRENEPVHSFLLERVKFGDGILKQINYDKNPFLSNISLRNIEYLKQTDYAKYKHIYGGEPLKHSKALVFNNKFVVDTFETPKDVSFYHGLDLGFTHPLALIRCFFDYDKKELYIDREAYETGVETNSIPKFLRQIETTDKWKIIADSSRPEVISFLKKKNFFIVPSKKGPKSVELGIDFLQTYKIIIHTRCKNTISEFETYSYKVDKYTEEVLPIIEDKNNHLIDALRYAVETVYKKDRDNKVNFSLKKR